MFYRFILVLFLCPCISLAQSDVSVDKSGLITWNAGNKPAYFFGVNYTVPFAYGYRSVKRTGITIEKAIDGDVYHFARLGISAFRVHVWDTEITDSLGNLLNNEHLRLFDYLLHKLEQRGIRIMLTPLAFWGNGYPEKDSMTGSFSSLYNKQRVLVEEPAIRAQENYFKQLLAHVNPYTKKRYKDDRFVVGLEINNEPHHSGSLKQAETYIARMVKAVKLSGWKKPIFYNISESPLYAKAVAEADVQGVSFQWYPTGLVSNHTLQGNFLPNVDRYVIPFDTIDAFKNKAKIVYEFDAADILAPVMYPAMARSFRKAGFQWATQFAYDPMATGNENTEYQTHYLNLAYTPQKAVSLMIAAKLFTDTSSFSSSVTYPDDTLWGKLSIYPTRQQSEWNSETAFFYTGVTSSSPIKIASLRQLAGIGNSEVVGYSGSGAYFLDRISEGVWRLECMPDVVELEDPFGRAVAGRIVRRIERNVQFMSVILPDLGRDFHIDGVNGSNQRTGRADGQSFLLSPGAYILRANGKALPKKNLLMKNISINEFVAPQGIISGNAETTLGEVKINSARILFNAGKDNKRLMILNPQWNKYQLNYPGDSMMQISITDSVKGRMFAWQLYIGDRIPDIADTLQIIMHNAKPLCFRIGLIDRNGTSYFSELKTDSLGLIRVPLNSLKPGPSLLLPRPYPGFQPLWFDSKQHKKLSLAELDKLEFILISDGQINTLSIKEIILK